MRKQSHRPLAGGASIEGGSIRDIGGGSSI